jgi:hypothetical protein
VTNRWLNCALDDEGVQLLQEWKEELQSTEEAALAIEEDLDDKLEDFTATDKRKPTLQFGTQATLNRLILQSVNDGVEDDLTIILTNPGPNLKYNALDAGTWNWQITDLRSLYNINMLYVELTTDTNGLVVTGPAAMCLMFVLDGSANADFLCFAPDLIIFGFLIFDFPLPTDEGAKHFTGGGDAPLQGVLKGLNAIYQGTGLTPTTAMDKLGVPVADSSSTTAEVLAETTDLCVLASGKRLSKTTIDNLSELRALWNLLGGDSDAADDLITIFNSEYAVKDAQDPLISDYGVYDDTTPKAQPIVVWTQDTATTITLPVCDGGQDQTTTTTSVVGTYNTKPATITSDMDPWVWWLYTLDPDIDMMDRLSSLGLDNDQIQEALDESNDRTFLVPDNVITDLSLTSAELAELMALTDVVGVGLTTISMETALDTLSDSEATAANGYISPSFNFPGDDIAESLSPEKSMTQDISDFNDSPCLDPLGKSQITTLIAMASATVDSVARIIERARSKVLEPLNAVSGVLANLDNVVNNLPAVSCLIGLDISAKGPDIDLMMPNIELMSIEFEAILEDMEAIIELALPKLCMVEEAIRSLLGPELGLVDCLVPGLSNELFNQLGTDLDLSICIENPFDVEGMLEEIEVKINAQVTLLNSLVSDVRSISSRLSLNISIEEQTDSEAAMGGCADPVMGALVSRIKSTFGA